MAVESKKAKCSKFKATALPPLSFPEMLTKLALCTKQEGDRISAKIRRKEIGGTGTVWPVELRTPVGQTEK